ncbi:MAG: hypothetical protein OXI34_04115 [Chloroflexota bacterium]|nr:hypothetical protein [Chloroflexota bacterium]MDE2945871.1 hypothetical protein [Chloroflexota bacterium]
MSLEFLTPEIFDAIIIINIIVGVLIAARRFRKDVSGPLPEDAPPAARERFESSHEGASAENS